MCRVRNAHTDSPWTTAYVCITIDDSCLDQNGQYIDKPLTVRMVQWQPYCVMKPFHKKTPVCAACKRTNRTRSFCRERHKHRALPWCTVYVLLSALDAADPSTVVAGASKKVQEGEEKSNNGAGEDSSPGDESSRATDTNSVAGDTIASDSGDPGDDIHDIAESRTFLAKVSCRATSIHWLELADFDPGEGATFSPAPAEPQYAQVTMDQMAVAAAPHQYYQPNMNFAAQQHQNALKSRQQYFFQRQVATQQQQQQQFLIPGAAMPPRAAPVHWAQSTQPPPPYQMGPSGQMEQGPGGDDETPHANHDDAAAAASTQAHQPQHLQQAPFHGVQQHWAAMYYPPPPAYTSPHVSHVANGQGHSHHPADESAPAENGAAKNDPSEAEGHGNEHYHRRLEDEQDDSEEQESKKQRVV